MEGEKGVPCCQEHIDEDLKLYCETCDKMICYKCATKFGKHPSHEYVEIPRKAVVSVRLEEINKAIERLRTDHKKITDQQASLKVAIGQVCDDNKTQLISQLQQITQDKLGILEPQLAELEAQRECCLKYIQKSVGAKKVQELLDTCQPDCLKPCTAADIIYTRSEGDCGKLSVPHFPDPTRCYASGNGLEVAELGEKSTVVVHAVNYSCEPCIQPISASLSCELSSEVTGKLVPCEVEMVELSKYKTSYQPTVKGRHCLHIKVNGQHIRGSPFSLAVKSLSVENEKLEKPIHTITGVSEPCGIAFSRKQEELIVSSRTGHCVYVFTPAGKKLRSFGSYGSDDGQFKFPEFLAVDRDGNILVVDVGNHRVQMFSEDGRCLKAVGTEGKTGALKFKCPDGIAINNTNNKVYVVDSYNDRIQILNPDLSFHKLFGSSGEGKGQLSKPRSIACDSSGKVYVTDMGNHRIQVFTADGDPLPSFGSHGSKPGSLDAPAGITFDIKGLIYISEDANHRVSVFTSEGVCLHTFGSHGDGPVQFNCPRGLAVDACGVVYVCDRDNDRIQVF